MKDTSPIREKPLLLNEKVVKTLRPPDGAMHLEFFVQRENLIFIEVGARPPGKSVVKCHELNFGINLYEITLRNELGLNIDFTEKRNLYHGWVCMPKVPGAVRVLNTPELKSQYEIEWHIKPGEIIPYGKPPALPGDSQ